mgnify:CR=1 FL=1|tara:strand:+ start:265 stop:5523 length:5259 start_codon:yes stop_codon:yes gene_type:complete
MEEEEILQYIETQRNGGMADNKIGMQLQMKGVSNYTDYLKKKDDTSGSPSASDEEDTESTQNTPIQGGQGAGSSVLPVTQNDPTVNTLVNGEPDLSIDPLTGQVIQPWTDTPANRQRLEIDPVHYDGFQKAGFIKVMEGLDPSYITPEIEASFFDFASNSGQWWWNSVGGNVDAISAELAKNDEYLSTAGIEVSPTSTEFGANPMYMSNLQGSGMVASMPFIPNLPKQKTEEQIAFEKTTAVKKYLTEQLNNTVVESLQSNMPADISGSEEALLYMEQFMLENYGSMLDLTGEGQVGNTPFLQFDGFEPSGYIGAGGSGYRPKFSGYIVDKFDAAGIDVINGIYNMFGGDAKTVVEMREKAEELRANTLQFTESMSGSFTDGQFKNGMMQMGGFVSEAAPTMAILIPAATVTTVATGGAGAPWWVTAGIIGLEGATLSTTIEAARTREHPMFKRYTKDGVTIGHYEMMEATGGDPELMANYEESFDDSARMGHLSTVFATDFVASGATSLFFFKALKGAGMPTNVGPNMNGWWNAHLTNMGVSVPVNSVTASTAAMVQYMSMNPEATQDEVFEVGMDVALGVVPITLGASGTGSAINYVNTKAQIVNALARDAVGRSGGNVRINQQRTQYLETLRNSKDNNAVIHAERMLVQLEEQKLSTMAADESFYLRMNPEDYETIVGLHRDYNSLLRQLNQMDDPDSPMGKSLKTQLDGIKEKRLNIEKLYEVDESSIGDPTMPPPDIFEPTVTGPDGKPTPLAFTPGLSKWWYTEFFDKYGDVNSLQRSIMEALDTDNTGKRIELTQDFEVLQKLSTSKAAFQIEEMVRLRTQDGGLIPQLRELQRTTSSDLYEGLPDVYDKNIIGLYDRWAVSKFAPERNAKILADNQAELTALKSKETLSSSEKKRITFLEEKIAERRGSGMADEEAASFLNSLPDELKASFEKVREEHRSIQQNTRDAALEYGFIDQAMYDKLQTTAENYVTLTGDGMNSVDGNLTLIDNDIVQAIFPQRASQGGVPDSYRKASGRSDETGSILGKTIDQNTQVHVAGQKNVALKGLYEMLLNNPNSKHYSISDEGNSAAKNTVMVYVNGEKKFITFANEAYAKPFKTQAPSDNESYVRIVQPMQRLFSNVPKMYTQWSTTFWAGNSVRDYQSSITNAISAAEQQFGYALNNAEGQPINIKQLVSDSHLLGKGEYIRAFKAIANDEFGPGGDMRGPENVLYQEYKAHGGKTGWAYRTPLQDLSKQLAGEIDDGIRGQKATQWMYDNSLGLIESFNNTFENVFRFQVYKGLRNQGVAPDYAAAVAKDVSIDFNRSGNTTPMLSSMKFFLNAGLQGADMTVKTSTALKPKVDVEGNVRNPIQRLTNAQKLLGGAVGFSYMLTNFNQSVSETDTDGVTFYDKIPDQIKQRNHIMMIPGSPTGEKVLIPKAYGFGAFNDLGVMFAEVQSGERDPADAALYWGSSAITNMSPVHFGTVGGSDDPTKSVNPVSTPGEIVREIITPDPLAPIIDVATNVDGFGNTIAAEEKPGVARSSQGYDSPIIFEQIAQILNSATGSDEISGPLDFNPDQLNYLMQSYLGSSYTMFGDASEGILQVTAGQDHVDTWPMIKKFYSEDFEYSAYGKYYDSKQVVNSYLAEFGNVEDLLENKDKPLPSRDERLADYAATETEPGGAATRYGHALGMAELFSDIETDMREITEAKKILQEKQSDLGYHMFNLEVADEWGGLEDKIYKLEQAEMLLMEKVLKEYYKFYRKPEE